jgi:hypothetical protein
MAFEELDLREVTEKEDLASKIESYYAKDMADKLLRAFTWDECIRFYDGDQQIEYNVSTNTFQQVTVTRNNDFIPKPTTNYILPCVKTVVSQLTKQKAKASVRSNSQDPRDISSAKLGDLVLDAKWEELHEDEKQQEKAYWGVITGTAFKKIFWNDTTGKVLKLPKIEKVVNQVPQVDEMGNPRVDIYGQPMVESQEVEQEAKDKEGNPVFEEFEIGDVDSAVIPPFNIAIPLNTRSPLEMDWIMEYSIQKIDWIQEQYDSKHGKGYTGKVSEVKEEKSLSVILQLEYRLRTLTGRRSGGHYATGSPGYFDMKNCAILKEWYGKPTKDYPRGRMVVVADGKTCFDGDSPYYEDGVEDSWNPYVEWRFEIVPGRAWGKGLVDELIPINRRINAIDALIILNRKTMAIPQWIVPEGSGVPKGYINGRPGLQINYRPVGANGAKPEKIDASALPQQVYQEREQAVNDIKRLGMTMDVLEGSNPQGVKTAYQLEQLLENAVASLGATFQRWEKSLEREETKKLLLIAKKYKEARPEFNKRLKAINKDVTDMDLDMFLGADLRDNYNVRVEPESSVPRSKAGENAILRELVQNGVLDVVKNSVNKREFLDKMGIKGFEYQSSPDVKRAQWENTQIEYGDEQSLIVQPSQQIPTAPVIDPATGQPVFDQITGQPAMQGGGMTPPKTVLELDDHETHITIHSARMKDPNITPEIRQKYLTHIKEHLDDLSLGVEAQQKAGVAAAGPSPVQKINQEQAAQATTIPEGVA